MIKMNIELDKRLKDAREAKGLSQNYVAEHLNITRQAISKWENGKSMPDLENLIILSTLYEISLDELLGRTPSPEETHEPQSSSANTPSSPIQEALFLAVIASISCLFPIIGLVIPIGILVWMKKKKRVYKMVVVLCVICLLTNMYTAYAIFNQIYFRLNTVGIKKL